MTKRSKEEKAMIKEMEENGIFWAPIGKEYKGQTKRAYEFWKQCLKDRPRDLDYDTEK